MSQFVWELVRDNNAFKVKGFGGEDFTKDPYSLTGRNNFQGLGTEKRNKYLPNKIANKFISYFFTPHNKILQSQTNPTIFTKIISIK
jgi:hypothetical protein